MSLLFYFVIQQFFPRNNCTPMIFPLRWADWRIWLVTFKTLSCSCLNHIFFTSLHILMWMRKLPNSSLLPFCSLTPSLYPFPSWVQLPVSRPSRRNSINSQRTLFASEFRSACVCTCISVCLLSIWAFKLWALCASVHKSVMCCVVVLCQCSVCVFVHVSIVLFFSSLIPCSCAPLNMSDVLERDITTGAEREVSSLSSPCPLYITSYWQQSLFTLSFLSPSVPDSFSQCYVFISFSLFVHFTFSF